MAGAGQSIQTMYLQMAVAKEFGDRELQEAQPAVRQPVAPRRTRRLLSGQEITASFRRRRFSTRRSKSPACTGFSTRTT